MRGFAVTQRCNTRRDKNWNSWYSMSTNLRSVSQTLRSPSVYRLMIRTDTSLDRDSRGTPRVRDRSPQNCVHHCTRCILSRLLVGLQEGETVHHRTGSTTVDSRGTPRVRDHSTRPELCPRTKTLAGLHECERRSTSLVELHECDRIPSSQVPNTFHTTHVQKQTKTVLA